MKVTATIHLKNGKKLRGEKSEELTPEAFEELKRYFKEALSKRSTGGQINTLNRTDGKPVWVVALEEVSHIEFKVKGK